MIILCWIFFFFYPVGIPVGNPPKIVPIIFGSNGTTTAWNVPSINIGFIPSGVPDGSPGRKFGSFPIGEAVVVVVGLNWSIRPRSIGVSFSIGAVWKILILF